MAGTSKSFVVATGGRTDLKQAQNILAQVLGKGGCPTCYSGIDIHFVNEAEFFAHNAQVSAAPLQAEQ
jgi:hypothetical protein